MTDPEATDDARDAGAPEGAGLDALLSVAAEPSVSLDDLAGHPLWLDALAALPASERVKRGVRFKVFRDDADPEFLETLEDRVPTEEFLSARHGPGAYLVRPSAKNAKGRNLREIRVRIAGQRGASNQSEAFALLRDVLRSRTASDRARLDSIESTAADAVANIAAKASTALDTLPPGAASGSGLAAMVEAVGPLLPSLAPVLQALASKFFGGVGGHVPPAPPAGG